MTATQRRGATTSSDIFRDVLCGIDGTRTSYEAVRQAASLVAPAGRLTLLAVCATGAGKHPVAVLAPERARRVLDHGRRLAKEAGASAEIELEPGGPVVDVVLSRAREHALLALGAPSMSRLAHLVVGGITTEAAHVLPPLCSSPAAGRWARDPVSGSSSQAMRSTARISSSSSPSTLHKPDVHHSF